MPALEVREAEGLGGLGGVEDYHDPLVGRVDGTGVVLEAHDDEVGAWVGPVLETGRRPWMSAAVRRRKSGSCGGWPGPRGSG